MLYFTCKTIIFKIQIRRVIYIKKLIIGLIVAIATLIGGGLFLYTQREKEPQNHTVATNDVDVEESAIEPENNPNGEYLLWIEDRYINTYSELDALKTYSLTLDNSYITAKGSAEPIFEEAKQYIVKDTTGKDVQFGDIKDALYYARENKTLNTEIYFAANDKLIWSYNDNPRTKTNIKLQNILQYPELPRGCEVTSLAMLLNAAGIKVDKMELASKVRKDTSFRDEIDGEMFWGSPYYGFVGDMYNSSSDGYGVYNQPIYDLAYEYMPNNVVNISGCEFSFVESFISKGYPVWVIITGEYALLPDSSFQKYMTSYGEINITQREHSVLVTGYDSNYVYINDPLEKKIKVPRSDFIDSFNQMGNQAISYVR